VVFPGLRTVFRELLSALQLRGNLQKGTEREWLITSNYARQLVRELDDLEERYGESAIANVSEDFQRAAMHYQDAAARVHDINLNLAGPAPIVSRAETSFSKSWSENATPLEGWSMELFRDLQRLL
jgi:hypothetical protein